MKNLLALFVLFLLFIQTASAQSPQSIPFQAVARDTNGILIQNQAMSVRLTIHDSTTTGTVVYKETQSVTTNNLGLFTLGIGQGTVVTGTFSSINWAHGPMYVQLEADPTGGTSYSNLGTSQLQSVPYALYSLNSGSAAGLAQPAGQIPYGTGSSITSDADFTRNAASGSILIKAQLHTQGSEVVIDTEKILLLHASTGYSYFSILSVGNGHSMGLDTLCVMAAIMDNSNNILYGMAALNDSVELITSDGSHNFGVVGTQLYNSYLDVGYNGGTMINSLTVDTDGLHWEYKDTNRYNFPVHDGSAGQVLSTNGSGNLSWTNANPSGKAFFTPASGATISAVWGNNIIQPSAGIAVLTIALPSSPADNETLYFTFSNTITAITFSGGTVMAPLTGVSSVSNGALKYWLTYDSGSSTWY